MKPSEQTQVNFIADCLRKGEKRGEVLSKFVKKWQTASTRTFDRRLKVAEKAVQGEQKRIQAEAEKGVAKEVDALKSKIMTAFERQELLTQIAKGEIKIKKPFVIQGKIMEYPAEPDHTDRINAVKELNKIDGSYAASKIDLNAMVVEPSKLDIGNLSADQLQMLLDIREKAKK